MQTDVRIFKLHKQKVGSCEWKSLDSAAKQVVSLLPILVQDCLPTRRMLQTPRGETYNNRVFTKLTNNVNARTLGLQDRDQIYFI